MKDVESGSDILVTLTGVIRDETIVIRSRGVKRWVMPRDQVRVGMREFDRSQVQRVRRWFFARHGNDRLLLLPATLVKLSLHIHTGEVRSPSAKLALTLL